MVPAVEHVLADVEDRFFRLVDLAHRELTFENEVVDEIDDRVMLRSIPIKLSRQIYYNTYFSRRKCHLSCLYSLEEIDHHWCFSMLAAPRCGHTHEEFDRYLRALAF